MPSKSSRPSCRPTKTMSFPVLKNKIRIYLEKQDILAHRIVDGERVRTKKGVIPVISALPEDYTTFQVEWKDCQKEGRTYMRTRYFPRSAIVIIDKLEAEKGRYIDVPAGTPMFLCQMSEEGILSTVGTEFTGVEVTVIIYPPDAETIKKYMNENKIIE